MKVQIVGICMLVLAVAGFASSQNASESVGQGSTYIELVQRIFNGERDMIADLRHTRPVIETYLQSLWPNVKTQSPIDDAYFLNGVDFEHSFDKSGRRRRGYLTPILAENETSNRIRVDNGKRWKLNSNGYLDMMFVDIEDFDPATYVLTYMRLDTLGEIPCLIFTVAPVVHDARGRFIGQIWVESLGLKIIRIKGTFTTGNIPWGTRAFGGTIPLYLHFDSWRRELTPGIWVPSYTYFDEDRKWQDSYHRRLETEFHYRGQTAMWGYTKPDGDSPKADADGMIPSDLFIAELKADKLVATPGPVEEHLNAIVRQISSANNVAIPDISCRVLLTTPLDIFNVDHTIFISRGLLNILPNESILAVLLAHELADVLFREPAGSLLQTVHERPTHEQRSIVPRSSDFEGKRVHRTAEENLEAWKTALSFADKSGYKGAIVYTLSLLSQLARNVPQVPNLVTSRFGPTVLEGPTLIALLGWNGPYTMAVGPLVLRGKYGINPTTEGLILQSTDSAEPRTTDWQPSVDIQTKTIN